MVREMSAELGLDGSEEGAERPGVAFLFRTDVLSLPPQRIISIK